MICLALIEGCLLFGVRLSAGAALMRAIVPRGIRKGLILDACGRIVNGLVLDALLPDAIFEGEIGQLGSE
jgi:hypothetical protein